MFTGRPSVVHPSVNTYSAWRDISLSVLSGQISIKLLFTMQVHGTAKRFSRSDVRQRSKSWPDRLASNGGSINLDCVTSRLTCLLCISSVSPWCKGHISSYCTWVADTVLQDIDDGFNFAAGAAVVQQQKPAGNSGPPALRRCKWTVQISEEKSARMTRHERAYASLPDRGCLDGRRHNYAGAFERRASFATNGAPYGQSDQSARRIGIHAWMPADT